MSKITIRENGSFVGGIYNNYMGANGVMTIMPPNNITFITAKNINIQATINHLEILDKCSATIGIEKPINIIKLNSGILNLTYNGNNALNGQVEITNGGVYNLESPCGYDLTFSYNNRDFKLQSNKQELNITALDLEQLVTMTDKLNEHFDPNHNPEFVDVHVYNCYKELKGFDKFANKDLLKVFIDNNLGFNFNTIATYVDSHFLEIYTICKSTSGSDLEIFPKEIINIIGNKLDKDSINLSNLKILPEDVIISISELNIHSSNDSNLSGDDYTDMYQTD